MSPRPVVLSEAWLVMNLILLEELLPYRFKTEDFFFFSLFLFTVCACICVHLSKCIGVCVWTCEGQRSTSCVVPQEQEPFTLLKTGYCWPELTSGGICRSLSPWPWDYKCKLPQAGFLYWGPNSGPYAYTANNLPSEPSSQPLVSFFLAVTWRPPETPYPVDLPT